MRAQSGSTSAFATTHNSMASTANGFVPPNQRRSMRAQLEHGIRRLPDRRLLRARPAATGCTPISRARSARPRSCPPAAVRSAQAHPSSARRAARRARRTTSTSATCSASSVPCACSTRCRWCAASSTPIPREVLVMVIEDYVAPDSHPRRSCAAGLESELLPVDPGAPLPTLEQMIDRGTRLQVSLENGALPPTLPERVHRPGGGDAVHVPPAARPRTAVVVRRAPRHRRRAGVPVQPLGHPGRTRDRAAG